MPELQYFFMPMTDLSKSVNIKRFKAGAWSDEPDVVAVEEPLEIRLEFGLQGKRQSKSLSVTMRTPGADGELVAGFLFTEGIVQNASEILSLKHQDFRKNVMLAAIAPEHSIEMNRLERHFYTTSSCGVCGKTSIEALSNAKSVYSEKALPLDLPPAVLATLPQALRMAQSGFDATGGLHASAIFDEEGRLVALREDVGRHNALDKLIGCFFLSNNLPLSQAILLLSGRVSFELVQKAAMAGVGTICAIGAPSSLAVETAQAFGIRLIGFLREDKFNQYC